MNERRHKVAVISGASAGIGKATALALAALGWRIIGIGRDPERTVAAAAEVRAAAAGGAPADFVRADLALMAEARRVAADIAALTPHVDVLINNAGGVRDRLVMTTEGIEATFASNHLAPFLLTRELLPLLRAAATQGPRARPLAMVAFVLAAIPVLTMTVTLYDPRYLTPFLCGAALFAARGASEMGEFLPRWGRRPRTWMTLLFMLSAPTTGMALHDAWREGREARTRLSEERIGLAVRFSEAARRPAMVFTDTPDFVAWTTGRAAVWVSREEYLALPLAAPGLVRTDRPTRGAGDVVWFHAAEGRGGVLPIEMPAVGGAGADFVSADSTGTVAPAIAPGDSAGR
jgi:hypothetical protein